MNEQAAFFRAIADDRDDDVPRLVYADWLEEQARPEGEWTDAAERAEFIRVQVAMARTQPTDPALPALRRRERELLARHGEAWQNRWREFGASVQFERGFPEEIILNANAFVQHDLALLHLAPTLRRLTLRNFDPAGLPIRERPSLGQFTTLRFSRGFAGQSLLPTLLESPYLGQLQVLDLSSYSFTDEELRSLLMNRLSHIHQLHLGGSYVQGDFIRRLLAENRYPRLRHLSLTIGAIPGLVESSLADLDRVQELLNLEQFELRIRTDSQGELLRSLAGLAMLRAVTHLRLSHNPLPPNGIRPLLAAQHAERLRFLDLSFTNLIATKIFSDVLKSPLLHHVETLLLSRVKMSTANVRNLVHSGRLRQLHTLDLSMNQLEDDSAKALAKSPDPVRLTTLDMIYNRIGMAGRRALTERFGADICLFDR